MNFSFFFSLTFASWEYEFLKFLHLLTFNYALLSGWRETGGFLIIKCGTLLWELQGTAIPLLQSLDGGGGG